MSSNLRIQIEIDSKSGEVRLQALGGQFDSLGKRGRSHLKSLADVTQQIHTKMSRLSNVVMSVGAAFAAWQIGRFANTFLQTAAALETMELKLIGVTGSSIAARESMDYLLDAATRMPFDIESIGAAFTKLQIAGLDPTRGSLDALTNAVAHFGGSSDELHRASLAIEQMAGKGVISMEELRRQLGEVIPNAIKIMALEMGISLTELYDRVQQGNLDAETGLRALMDGFEKYMGGASERMMTGWKGMVARFKVEWQLFQKEVMDQDIFIGLKASLKTVTDLMREWRKAGEMSDWAKTLAETVIGAFSAIVQAAVWVGRAFMGWGIIWAGVRAAWDVTKAAILDGVGFIAGKLGWLMERIADAYAFWGRLGEAGEARALAAGLREFNAEANKAADLMYEDYLPAAETAIKTAVNNLKAYETGIEEVTKRWRENKAAIEAAAGTNMTAPSMPELTQVDKNALKALDDYSKRHQEVMDRTMKATSESVDYQVYQLEKWYDESVAIYDKAGKDTTEIARAYTAEYLRIHDEAAARTKENPIGMLGLTTEQLTQGITELDEYLMTEEERLFEATVRREQMVYDALDRRIVSEQRARELILQIEQDYQNKLKGMQQLAATSWTRTALDGLGALQQLAQVGAQHSEKMFGLYKALAIATAVVKAYEAISSAYAAGMAVGGPTVAAAWAKRAAIVQFANVAAITAATLASPGAKGSNSGGGAEGGGGGSTSANTASTSSNMVQIPNTPQQNVSVFSPASTTAPARTISFGNIIVYGDVKDSATVDEMRIAFGREVERRLRGVA